MSLEPIMESGDLGIWDEEEEKEEEASKGDATVGSGSKLSRVAIPPEKTGVRAGFMSAPKDDAVHECAVQRCARDIGHGAQCTDGATISQGL